MLVLKRLLLISLTVLVSAGCSLSLKTTPSSSGEKLVLVEEFPDLEEGLADIEELLEKGEDLPASPEFETHVKEVREKILLGLPEQKFDFPIEINERVTSIIVAYMEKFRESFQEALNRSGRYLNYIKKVFRERGLPEDLAYLPLIESAFKERAVSRKRAKGLWQFMRSTARKYGLRVDWWIDERYDPIKSTVAAARYLEDLYQEFQDWYLAIAAYNAGEGRIRRAIKRAGSRNFWDIMPYIRRETRNYVPAFIASLLIAKNPEQYGFSVNPEPPFEYDEVEIPSPTDLRIVAECAGVSYRVIKQYNLHLLRYITPSNVKKIKIRLPKGLKERFYQKFAKLKPSQRLKWTWHIVRKGETLYSISRKYSVPYREIKRANNLRSNLIKPGWKLLIPLSAYSPRIRYSRKRVSVKGKVVHIVKPGETLYSISRKYNVSIRYIKRINSLKSNLIKPGDRLIIRK